MATNFSNLKAWLTFNRSPTDDAVLNSWTTYGNPTIGTANAFNGNALQLDGQSYIKLSGVELGGKDFYIDGWIYVDAASPNNARIITIVNPNDDNYLVSLRKSSSNSSRLEFWGNNSADSSAALGYVITSNTNSVGSRVHFKLIYRYSNRDVYLCINDKIVANRTTNVPQYSRQNFDIYIGANSEGLQGLIGSIDELRIYDGYYLSAGNNTPPTLDDYSNIIFSADLRRNANNLPVTINFDTARSTFSVWRYENFGTADLLSIAGTTVTNLDKSQAVYQTAFYQPTCAKCFDIPATKEIWIKCDINIVDNVSSSRIRIYSDDDNGINGWSTSSKGINSNYIYWHNDTSIDGGYRCSRNDLGYPKQTFLLHMKSGTSDGLLEFYFWSKSNPTYRSFTGNVNNGDDFNNVYIQMDGSNIYVSDLIISNVEVDINDNVDFSVDFNADAVRDTRILWRYENYGTADLLTSGGTTVTNLPAVQSFTHSAFSPPFQSSYGFSVDNCATINITPTDEIWIKFDVTRASDGVFWFGSNLIYTFTSSGGYIYHGGQLRFDTTARWLFYESNSAVIDVQSDPLLDYSGRSDRLIRILVHMKSDATNGIIELFNSDGANASYTGNVNNGILFDDVSFALSSSNYNTSYISNVIISNSPVDLSENTVQSFCQFNGDLKRLITKTVTINFDTFRRIFTGFLVTVNFDLQRKLANFVEITFDIVRELKEIWRYENYGTGNLLEIAGIETKEVPNEFSRTGYAFVVPLASTVANNSLFDIPLTDEIWIKFDWSRGLEYAIRGGFHIKFGTAEKYLTIHLDSESWLEWDVYPDDGSTSLQRQFDLRNLNYVDTLYSKLHRLLLHVTENQCQLWIDDFYFPINNGAPVQNISLFKGNSYEYHQPLISNVIISNSPVFIWEDVANVAFPRQITLNIGAYRDIANPTVGIWRYENYGTDELLQFRTSTITNLPSTQSKTGSAFIQYSEDNCFKFAPTTEVWLQFDVFVSEPLFWIDAGIVYLDVLNFSGEKELQGCHAKFMSGSTALKSAEYDYRQNRPTIYDRTLLTSDCILTVGKLSTCLLHLKIGSLENGDVNQGLIEFWIDGVKGGSATGNINGGKAIDALSLYTVDTSKADCVLYSNIIISNVNPNLQLLQADLSRVLSQTINLNIDAVRTLPHKFFSAPIEHFGDVPDVHNTSAGLQQFEIRISEQQLTDVVTYTTINPVNILEQVNGQFLDYKFSMRIESLQQRGVLYTCNCCSDIDEILFTQIDYNVPENEKWHWADGSPEVYGSPDSAFKKPEDTPPAVEADVHVAHIAEVLNKKYVMRFDNFVSTVDGDSGGVTYNDLIRSIFGWTSRIPHKLINCYLRDDTLFVIQRGHEQNVIDLSDSTFEIVTRDKSLIRTFWGNKIWSKTEIQSKFLGWRTIYEKENNKTKTSQDGKAVYSYDNGGLITQTSIYNDDGSTTYIDYQYTDLNNGRKVLASESHSTYKDGERIDYQVIQHTYLNQGQSHIMATSAGGDYLGGDVGQSIGDDRVTPWGKYTSLVRESVYKDQERTIYGLTNFDSSFPVDGDKKLKEITSDIIWLNRKTQEIVTLNLYDFPHVVDFNDRLIINGNEYYLKSNIAIQTPYIVNKQTLQLVRWY